MMTLKELMLDDLKNLDIAAPVKHAVQGCIDSPFRSHFPVFDKGLFIGLFSEEDIQTFESESTKLSHYKDLLQTFSATQNTALLDLIKLFATHDTNIIPIVNEDMYYQGYYDLKDILSVFASTPFFSCGNMIAFF